LPINFAIILIMRQLFIALALLVSLSSMAQKKQKAPNYRERPKLVVGIIVDQMRWDYLYRYYDRYTENGGFKRFLHQGFTCENTLIPYTPSITACGHATVYTGTTPAIHGITGNDWFDNVQGRSVYCVEDAKVQNVGSTGKQGQMSPKNMQVTTITDELRLGTNFRSKVVGISIKDRGAILPAGHTGNAAYWYDGSTGKFITSTHYMNDLPNWAKEFNAKDWPGELLKKGWETLYPIDTYVNSSSDENGWEETPFSDYGKKFPYDLKGYAGKNYGKVSSTPHGNTLTFEFAKAALLNEGLGKDEFTDFLAVSFSSPDYVGHAFGPNSIEAEDNYLRLDIEMGEFFDFLDKTVGKGEWMVFLSADHGAAHVPAYLNENRIPAGTLSTSGVARQVTKELQAKYGTDRLISGSYNYQISLNHKLIDSMKLNVEDVKATVITLLESNEIVERAFDNTKTLVTSLPKKVREMVVNGYYPDRSGDIQIILKPQYFSGSAKGTTHGSWYNYDTHIPLLFYGWKIPHGKLNRETYMTDIAPTLAALLKLQMPSGATGHVIEEVVK
jgi:predicted AlkP superfamily pyrophosphatase or phosphodiesterase